MMIASRPSGPGGDFSMRWHAWLYRCMSVTEALLSPSKISFAMLAPSGAMISVPDMVRTMLCPADLAPSDLGFSSILLRPASVMGTQKSLPSALYHSPLSSSLSTKVMPIGGVSWNSNSRTWSSASRLSLIWPFSPAFIAARVLLSTFSQSQGFLVPTPQWRSRGPGPLSLFSGTTVILTFFSFVTATFTVPFLRPRSAW
mmetsp:Transcript_4343/g.10491  ORF Transcript_4343/g.10491 Transcript_4343/m.10491 type:complete len:200 (+) Transcript_4343:1334-1933(+)